MPSRTVVVAWSGGLHARPAAVFAAAAAAQPVPVTIRIADRLPVPAASLLSVLSLGAGPGAEVILEADGPGADAALAELAALLRRDLDGPEVDQGD